MVTIWVSPRTRASSTRYGRTTRTAMAPMRTARYTRLTSTPIHWPCPVADFTCTFCYAVTPLMVTSTVPAVGGNFTPPAPGTYNYDVNFNQAVDPASVQDSDLTVSGNSAPSVTGHILINGNTTVRFTL